MRIITKIACMLNSDLDDNSFFIDFLLKIMRNNKNEQKNK